MRIAIIFAALLGGCASTPKEEACIPPQVQMQCQMEGGCSIVSKAAMDEIMAEIFAAGVQQCRGKM